ncbi:MULTISPECIES: LemA family protein [unclassified Lactococcus]|uniref:LemA family protein n=1 Tax=unclassified Lactococcus TaxID=2643510 RepID=UPI0011CA0F4B|nr:MULTISPECIES: LemA family protein [unclassified Lactococcus]MQW22957.1 LemA family protein [Lactococcus sp. dk101]TXK44498.1 LemA family protein [Lactococcus sp. dk310]TXK50351.1 LemA family protein [Lactococcus sp. dk322]
MKKITIIISALFGLLIVGAIFSFLVVASVNNRTVVLEEAVSTSKANISKEEQRRVDLFNNLVESVKSYNQHESETLKAVTEARKQADKGDTHAAMAELNAVVEKYPDLKAQTNYSQINKEFSLTENRLANYREAYNSSVQSYNRYVRSFFANIVLDLKGYQPQNYKYLNYSVKNQDPRNLF